MEISFIQTADAFRYAEMLSMTARTVTEYCRRHGFRYENFVGIKRGRWPWQATYNRIIQLKELVDRGISGWVVHLDADAYIVDLEFDLRAYLADKADRSAIFMPSMATDEQWDINAGVFLINLSHPLGRQIVERWFDMFNERLSDDRLAASEEWLDADSDQDLIQIILREDPVTAGSVYLQPTNLMNSSYATFIRQHLRGYSATFEDRLAMIRSEVAAVMGARTVSANTIEAEEGAVRALARTHQEIVTGLYRALLGRDPDAGGLENATAQLDENGLADSVRDLALSILASAEYRSRAS